MRPFPITQRPIPLTIPNADRKGRAFCCRDNGEAGMTGQTALLVTGFASRHFARKVTVTESSVPRLSVLLLMLPIAVAIWPNGVQAISLPPSSLAVAFQPIEGSNLS